MGVSGARDAFDSLTAVGNILLLASDETESQNRLSPTIRHAHITPLSLCDRSGIRKVNIPSLNMGKKGSGEAPRTRTRSPKSTRKPSGRGFTGHRGRGRGGRYIGGIDISGPIGNEERPESAIDSEHDSDVEEEEEDEGGSDGSSLVFTVLILAQHFRR